MRARSFNLLTSWLLIGSPQLVRSWMIASPGRRHLGRYFSTAEDMMNRPGAERKLMAKLINQAHKIRAAEAALLIKEKELEAARQASERKLDQVSCSALAADGVVFQDASHVVSHPSIAPDDPTGRVG